MHLPTPAVHLAVLSPLLVAACADPAPVAHDHAPPLVVDERDEVGPEEAAALFATHCAACHGTDGRANGEASPFLFPPARDFTHGKFRLVSTANGAPTEEDLVSTLRRGMPGSAMPSWRHLGEEELAGLARHVRKLALEGLTDRILSEATAARDPMTVEEAAAVARERLEPGKPLPAPPADLEATGDRLARGEELFRASCASCHGEDGTGESEPLWTETGELSWARDLTAGFLEGGASREALAHRIGAGLPGTAMPPTRLDEDDLAALVLFVESLIPDGTEDRLVQDPVRLRAKRVSPPLPHDPDDPAWSWTAEEEVVLAPLAWREESVVYAVVGALHDGTSIAIRMRWPDTSGEATLFTDSYEPDGAALQFSGADDPPLFGMGAPGRPTNIWHWRSLRLSDVAGALDLIDPTPHVVEPSRLEEVELDAPVYRRFEGTPELSREGETLTTTGVRTLESARSDPGSVTVNPRWSDGEWAVVFTRTLEPGEEGDVRLEPGSTVRFACAVWNGAAGDSGPRKSISIWHEMEID